MTEQGSTGGSNGQHGIAVEHCSAGIAKYVRWRADAVGHLDNAMAADENYALPRLAKAWILHGARDAAHTDTISTLITEAEGSLPAAQCREAELLSALKLGRAGQGVETATVLDELLYHSPTDALMHHFIQNELFWMGRSSWMCDITERAAPAWDETAEHYGSFLSMRAFANEEAGRLDEAERFGRMAVDIDSADVWGAHAVAHVLLMKGEMHKGIDWLAELSPNWGHANQLRHHLWWHVCLFLLETGQHDRILDLLTVEIRNPESPMIKAAPAAPIDIQNFASLLIRLELYGVDVGSHWQTLATVCADRVHNHGHAFSNIHDMMVLAATGQFENADEMLSSMRSHYNLQSGSVALAYNAAGIPACEAVLAHRKKDYKRVLELLGGIRHDFSLLGASHAQRDVLFHLLVHAAEQEERDDLRGVFVRDIERIGFCDVPARAAYKNRAH